MSDNQNLPQPDPALRRLDRLVGTWTMQGNLAGADDKNIRARQPSAGFQAASSSSSGRGSTSWASGSTPWS
jgi:hypothetical protein